MGKISPIIFKKKQMNINLFETMRIFVQVVESGNLAKAADILDVHRPAVTRAIQQLENHLGVRLLHRTTRTLHLTSEGDLFYQRCKNLLNEVDDTMDCFTQDKPIGGVLRVDIAVVLANNWIIPRLPEFQKMHPDLKIVLYSSDYKGDLIKDGIDCAVRIGDLGNVDLIAKSLGSVKMMTCAAPSYLSQYGTPKNLSALTSHHAVNFLFSRDNSVMPWYFKTLNSIEKIIPPKGIMSDNSESFLACGLAGFGILQGLQRAFAPYLATGELVEVLADFAVPDKKLSLIYPHRQVPRKVRLFELWLQEIMN